MLRPEKLKFKSRSRELFLAKHVDALIFAALLAAASSTANAAAITFNTAFPVSKGGIILREQGILTRSSDEFEGVKRKETVIEAVSVLGFGVMRKLAVFGVLPVVHLDREIGGIENRATNIGDATVFARMEAARRDRPERTIRFAPFAGFVAPTGKHGRTGDGSLDVFAGAVLTAATTDWVFDSQIKYVVNNEANDFERGDAASADASLQFRLFPQTISANADGFLFGVLEANVTHFEENRLAGLNDPNSGGTQVLVSPGVQYAEKRWIVETAIRIPVLNDFNGDALEPDYSLIVSLRINF